MIDNSTPTKKEFSSNEKTSNNTPVNLNDLNQENNILQENILNSSESYQNKNSKNYTFKIVKRRVWDKKEDETIIELVNKYGTTNWAIIANEMAAIYKSNQRNGKQCRERWYNNLDPIVNKDNWTEEEESILFKKHLEYGNKWIYIAQYLPGRSENSIKNHFYSKLRKFIRKILKKINEENLLKNSGIDLYNYSCEKVYKLLKKNKISYKNITKESILDIIIGTEKNQKNKIYGVNDENKLTNNFSTKNNSFTWKNLSFNIENDMKKDNTEYEVKAIEIKNEELLDENTTNIGAKYEINTQNISKNKRIINNENCDINNKNARDKNRLTINLDDADETYKFRTKSKTKIKGNNVIYNKKILNKKRRRTKRKVAISLSTIENKKNQISRIIPKRKYIFGLGQKLFKRSKNNGNNNLEIFPQNFDHLINNVEIVRDGLEIHSKSIILINKSLLTEKLFLEINYDYKPNLNISIPPLSPKAQQFQSRQAMKTGEENSYIHNFNERNISMGLPNPMDGYYEQQINFEKNFFRKNFSNPYGLNSSMTPNTPKKEINLKIHNNINNINNVNEIENNDDTNIEENSKKPPILNMDLIDNYNENNESITSPLFPGSGVIEKQIINSSVNIFNLSPTSPFIPRNFEEK